MMGIVAASVALLAGLILFQSDSPIGLPPGSPCAYEKGPLDSVIITGFVHERVMRSEGIFDGETGSLTTTCAPEADSGYDLIVENISITESHYVDEESALASMDFYTSLGTHTVDNILDTKIEIVSNENSNYLQMLWRDDTSVFVIAISAFFDLEDVDMQFLEDTGTRITNLILGDI